MNQTPDPNAMPGSNPTPAGPPPGPMDYQQPPQGPMGYAPPAAPPAKKSNRTALIILGVLALLVVGGVAYALMTRDSSPGAVDALQVGDCIDEPDEDSTITEVQHQPCTVPHDGEVFAVLTNPAGPDEPYPVVSGFDDYIQTNCIPLWEAYTGRTWATDTELDIGFLHPTLTGWGAGDRGFSCYTTKYGGGKLLAPVKNIGASPLPVATP
ncbi:MAG TPA: septum formation family protein [Candidatus Limnocylindria bacterium]|nr:septum formation family protein [Candidatus Limnocylindria bacterium]